MPSSAKLRHEIEVALNSRFSEALRPRVRQKPIQTLCGIPALDELLHGGLPAGVLTEFVGSNCSGRMTVALAYTAAILQAGGVSAWIDVSDSLDPESAAAAGVSLERLLWVRCGVGMETKSLGTLETSQCGPGPAQNVSGLQRHTGGGSPHPRSESRDMPQAVSALLQAHGGLYDKQLRREKRSIGTPGAPNRPLTHRSDHREEQVNSDRLPPRRGDNLKIVPRCAEPLLRQTTKLHSNVCPSFSPLDAVTEAKKNAKPWPLLDQALRVTDLLMQGGGFNAIILDLGGTPPEAAWRIPLATWFRFRAACERTQMSLILLTQHPCARSAAELVVRMQGGSMESESRVMTGVQYQAATQRSRSYEAPMRVVPIRKPPQTVPAGAWRSDAKWAQKK